MLLRSSGGREKNPNGVGGVEGEAAGAALASVLDDSVFFRLFGACLLFLLIE